MGRVNIAIASPGDVTGEREAVPKVFTRWNNRNEHVTLHPVMWESASVPTLGDHPQHILDESIVKKSDLLVAILWSKLGTPTPTAPSGTVEEIREFIKIKGPKRVMLYFCTRDLPYNTTNPADLAQLQDFKAEMRSQGLYHEYTTVEQLERDLYLHLDAKVNEFLQNKLPLPEPTAVIGKSDSATPKRHPDPRLCEPIDFGTCLAEISSGFASRLDQFDAIDGGGPDKFLNLAAHVYNSVAFCLDRFLAFSAAGMSQQNKSVLERISTRLKRLGTNSSGYLKLPFPQYWKDGREICNELAVQVQFLSHTA
jgi:hypothetical protein